MPIIGGMNEAEAAELAAVLRGVVSDHPVGSPRRALQECADRLAAGPGGAERDGLVVILNATAWYAGSGRMGDPEVAADMEAALRQALGTLDAGGCAGGDGHRHVDGGTWDLEEAVTVGALLLTSEGREAYEAAYRDGEYELPLDAWCCPGTVAALAKDGIDSLAVARRKREEDGKTARLDEVFVRQDGRVDVPLLAATAGERRKGDGPSAAAGLWAARRLLAGGDTAEDRLGVLLALGLCVSVWYEGLGHPHLGAMEAAIETIDLADLDAPCPHGDAAHPWQTVGRADARLKAITTLFEDATTEPGDTFDLWACPRNLAELAEQCLSNFTNWRVMRMIDD